MPSLVEVLRPWSWPRAAALTLMTIGVAGCSAESGRFNDNPNARVETTASIPAAQPVSAGRVESRPLPPATAQTAPPPMAARPDTVAANQGMAGGGRGMASYTPNTPGGAPMPAADVTGSVVAPRPAPSGHWSWEGGTPVTVAPGDTVESISRRHGVPASAIMQANNLTPPGAIHPGQQLVIPRYSHVAGRERGAGDARRHGAAVEAARPQVRGQQPDRQSRRARGRARRDAEQDLAPLRQVARRHRQGQQPSAERQAQGRRPPGHSGRAHRPGRAERRTGDRAGKARAGSRGRGSPPANRCRAPASSRRWRNRRPPRRPRSRGGDRIAAQVPLAGATAA